MAKQIIFFHGGGSKEDYEADKKLVESLSFHLGPDYIIHDPYLPDDGSPDLGRRRQIKQEIANGEDGVLLVAHSLGASMLLALLSESDIQKNVAGIFLLATPFWQGNDDWVIPFKLHSGFAANLDQNTPLFFYHCTDDEDVSISHLGIYKQKLPWANFQEIASGGHQFTNNLNRIADEIKSLQKFH